jgi:protoporphyrinogen oxidase
MTVYVLGGGPAGLALVDGLCAATDVPFVVVERDGELGGLARTIGWDGIGAHDLGPHKIFTTDKALFDRVRALLPDSEWLTRPKTSSIYMRGHYLPYPPSPFSLGRVYGYAALGAMTLDYLFARLRSLARAPAARTFEDDLATRVGNRLYGALFRPIALKLWGDPARLDVKLSQGRVQTPSLWELVKRTVGVKSADSFEAREFLYPRGGLVRLWDAIRARTAARGEFQLNREVVRLDIDGARVRRIVLRDRASGLESALDVAPGDFVFSTLPLGRLADFLGAAVPPTLKSDVGGVLALNDLILVFLHVAPASVLDESWIFVPDPEILFHRVSEQESFDPGMTPNGSIVCCEVMDNDGRPTMRLSDAELVDGCVKGLERMGHGCDVLHSRVIRLRASYPVFRPGYGEVLERSLASVDRIGNLRTIGRQGAFNYIGTLDAMDIGYGAARWYCGARAATEGDRGWRDERARTSHYPVLD